MNKQREELAKKDKRFHENLPKKIFNFLIVAFLRIISLLPFWLMYLISDFLNFFIQHVFRYRRKVIFENLHHAFPEKNDEEIKLIARKFYRHLTDIMLEAVKMHGMSEKEMRDRVKYTGLEQFEKLYLQNKSLLVLSFHHNNWEWTSGLQLHINHQAIALYNPIRGNQMLENFILQSREKWGSKCVPVHKAGRTVLEFNRAGKPTLLGLAADQTPKATSKFWTVFLNREAPFFSGPEKIAKRTNQPVFFHQIRKISRGKYEMIFTPICENPKEIESKEILLDYIRKMEEIIREEPAYYLWSHRRWKHKRPKDIPLTK